MPPVDAPPELPVDGPLELLERRCWRGFLVGWVVAPVAEEFGLLGAVVGPLPRGDAWGAVSLVWAKAGVAIKASAATDMQKALLERDMTDLSQLGSSGERKCI
jgi:hypothetical protein